MAQISWEILSCMEPHSSSNIHLKNAIGVAKLYSQVICLKMKKTSKCTELSSSTKGIYPVHAVIKVIYPAHAVIKVIYPVHAVIKVIYPAHAVIKVI